MRVNLQILERAAKGQALSGLSLQARCPPQIAGRLRAMSLTMKRILLGSVLGLLLVTVLALALALQGQALLPPAAEVQSGDVARAKEFLKRNDPRRVAGNPQRLVTISEADLNLLLGQAALYSHAGAAQLRLHPGLADLRLSLLVPKLGLWLNVQARLRETGACPSLNM